MDGSKTECRTGVKCELFHSYGSTVARRPWGQMEKYVRRRRWHFPTPKCPTFCDVNRTSKPADFPSTIRLQYLLANGYHDAALVSSYWKAG